MVGEARKSIIDKLKNEFSGITTKKDDENKPRLNVYKGWGSQNEFRNIEKDVQIEWKKNIYLLCFERLYTDMDKVHLLASKLKEDFNNKKYKAIRIIYTRYVNSITFEPTVFQILPVQVPKVKWTDDEFAPPLFDEEPRTMLHQVLPSYLTGILHEIVLDSFLSEQASRRTAMDNANDNADELLGKLTIEYNKARQGAITQQITEVASGANAGE